MTDARVSSAFERLIDRVMDHVSTRWMHSGERLSESVCYTHGQRGYTIHIAIGEQDIVDVTEPTLYRAAASALRDFDQWAADQECELTEALEVSLGPQPVRAT